ncbi:YolD-like family protein [Jeotgalicoccus huakuii]|nr:YolD-like family protein [Jeotgalicoccus huakuii]
MDNNHTNLDYRYMPPELLNNNIPQGRTMIKWAPFATMPEQYENVDKMIEAQVHVPEPYLTEDLLQALELKLRELIDSNVILRYWSVGYEHQIECKIEHIDNWSRVVSVSKEGNLIYVEFKHIYEVRRYDYI